MVLVNVILGHKGGFFVGETFECVIYCCYSERNTVINHPAKTGLIYSWFGYGQNPARDTGLSAQNNAVTSCTATIQCMCKVNSSLIALQESQSTSNQHVFYPNSESPPLVFTEELNSSKSFKTITSPPSTLFSDTCFTPNTPKTFRYSVFLPREFPPTFRGLSVSYSYKFVLNFTFPDRPLQTLKIPFKVLPYCHKPSSSIPASIPFCDSNSSLDYGNHDISITATTSLSTLLHPKGSFSHSSLHPSSVYPIVSAEIPRQMYHSTPNKENPQESSETSFIFPEFPDSSLLKMNPSFSHDQSFVHNSTFHLENDADLQAHSLLIRKDFEVDFDPYSAQYRCQLLQGLLDSATLNIHERSNCKALFPPI
eukprot:Sdes_comp18500_c0_seq1m8518